MKTFTIRFYGPRISRFLPLVETLAQKSLDRGAAALAGVFFDLVVVEARRKVSVLKGRPIEATLPRVGVHAWSGRELAAALETLRALRLALAGRPPAVVDLLDLVEGAVVAAAVLRLRDVN